MKKIIIGIIILIIVIIIVCFTLFKNEAQVEDNINYVAGITFLNDYSSRFDSTVFDEIHPVISSETINLSHYGPDCIGCESLKTASGYYIGNGNIKYIDDTFKEVRIVAADRKYPFGTILRLTYSGSSILAIVLDRGGGIGDNSKYQIDLLELSEKDANKLGSRRNVILEVLRLGY